MEFADPADPGKGLVFDGRLAEDFKLSTGTWVSVGPLRARFIDHFSPYVRDVVIAGADRDDVTALVFPELVTCRSLCGDLPSDAKPEAIIADTRIEQHFASLLSRFAAASAGSSMRVCRIVLLAEPPLIDAGEMTDKGSINQRAVLKRRAALVAELYCPSPSARVIAIEERP
jgi:feruloyl-CoA synthase